MKLGDRARAWEIGRKGHETYEWAACVGCGKERWVVVLKGKVSEAQCHRCGSIAGAKRYAEWHAWKGGRIQDNGYFKVYVPDNHPLAPMRPRTGGRYIAEHRFVMAQHLGRLLDRYEFVHHKDGNRANNNINNLELLAAGQHSKDHNKGYRDGFDKGYTDGLATVRRELRDEQERNNRAAS